MTVKVEKSRTINIGAGDRFVVGFNTIEHQHTSDYSTVNFDVMKEVNLDCTIFYSNADDDGNCLPNSNVFHGVEERILEKIKLPYR